MAFTKNLQPTAIHTNYDTALGLLQATDRTVIGHIDTGVTMHEALGWNGTTPPPNLQLAKGRNLISGNPASPPINQLRIGTSTIERLTDYPDHGTKTLSCILSNNAHLKGVAPGAQVVPVMIANGPVFSSDRFRDNMGPAMRHLMGLDPVPRVISISMGNPGFVGPIFAALHGLVSPGFNSETRAAFDEAYEMGIIVVASAGQVIDRVIYPARYGRTISVGGFSRNRVDHYPPDEYDVPDRVDIWAQADGVNRAQAERRGNDIVYSYAEDAGANPRDISGTSYAAPQVAGAAALWVNLHWNALPKIGDADAWKTVEAFRNAVRSSADILGLQVNRPHKVTVRRPALNIERLLGTAPDLSVVTEMAPAAKFWGRQQ